MDTQPVPMAPPSARATARQRSRRIAVAVAAAALVIALLAVMYLRGTAERRAIARLPAPERRALYDRTLSTLRSTCNPHARPAGLEGYCADQAAFIQRFPECDSACEDLAAHLRDSPTR